MMETLHLTLKKKWFDMILSGEKKEEYREVKPYWRRRLVGKDYEKSVLIPGEYHMKYNEICFTNGYGKHLPSFTIKVNSLIIGKGEPDWGAEPDKYYFVLELGEILSTRNIPFEKTDEYLKDLPF